MTLLATLLSIMFWHHHVLAPSDPKWSTKLFPTSAPTSNIYPQFYLGEDDEEKYEGVDDLFRCKDSLEEEPPKFGPRVEISKEKYLSLFQ